MPFTPFHFGPGLLLKAVTPRRFSFTAYAATQVVIDCETGYYLLRGEWPVHRVLHTLLVGGVVGAAAGTAIGVGAQRWFRAQDRPPLRGETELTPSVAGGLVGGLLHSLLDAIMHPAVRPLWPFSGGNPMQGMVGLGALHGGCVVTGIIGILLLMRRAHWRVAV
jgi:hypothetical protein